MSRMLLASAFFLFASIAVAEPFMLESERESRRTAAASLPLSTGSPDSAEVATPPGIRPSVARPPPWRTAPRLLTTQLDPDAGRSADTVHIAWNGTVYLVAWNHLGKLVATRVTPTGETLDEPPFVVADEGMCEGVATDGRDFFVVYLERGRGNPAQAVLGRRISVTDQGPGLVGSDPASIDTDDVSIYGADVSFGGGVYLVAWWSHPGTQGTAVNVRRVSLDGEPLGSPLRISSSYGDDADPALVFGDDRFLLAWSSRDLTRCEPGGFCVSSVEAAFIDPASGTASATIAISDPPATGLNEPIVANRNPRTAWNGSHYLVAWTAERLHHPGFDQVLAVRLDRNGQFLAERPVERPEAILFSTNDDSRYFSSHIDSLSADKGDFFLLWEYGSGLCTVSSCSPPEYELHFGRVTGDGHIQGSLENYPGLGRGQIGRHASSGEGHSLVVYEQWGTLWTRIFGDSSRRRSLRR